MNTRHKYYNPNPLNKKSADCVVRAICKATGKDWDTIYKELCELGFELKDVPNGDATWKEYLKRNNFIHHKISNKKGSKRPRVNGFSDEHRTGTYVLNVANHIVTCVDGYYYDSFDSGDSCLYGYYEKK